MSRIFEYFTKYISYSIQSGILWFLRLTTLVILMIELFEPGGSKRPLKFLKL